MGTINKDNIPKTPNLQELIKNALKIRPTEEEFENARNGKLRDVEGSGKKVLLEVISNSIPEKDK